MSSKIVAARATSGLNVYAAEAIFALATFAGALLLFFLEPMFVKMALPRLGGSSEVWTACVLFYQSMLLAGYTYAHLLRRLSKVRHQALLHGAVCCLALLVLPLAIPAAWQPPSAAGAVPWLITTLLVTAGLPFFVLSATSPLLQSWFALARPGHNPYSLYAASNAGSLTALLLYPFIVEPLWGLRTQSIAWAAAYAGFVALVGTCAIVARRGDRARATAGRDAAVALTLARRLRWILWAFIPSSLMLSVTTYLSERVAPIPLLWALPLGLYLASFIIVFSARTQRCVTFVNRYTPLAVMPLVFVLSVKGALPPIFEIVLHAVVFACFAIVCHGAIAKDRPDASQLTEFYLFVAAGGALGGAFNSIIAPLVFPDIFEYPIVVVLACATLASWPEKRPGIVRLDVVLPIALTLGVCAVVALATHGPTDSAGPMMKIVIGTAVVACFSFAGRPLRFGLGVAGLLVFAGFHGYAGDLLVERNFYGVKHVTVVGTSMHALVHGHTRHGAENMLPALERSPLTYYTPSGPLGDIFRAVSRPRPAVAVVGLGAGSTACYRKPGAAWTFYEIDPAVVSIARNVKLFRYLADCAPNSPIVVGDARLSLMKAPPAAYDVIVLDAYASDAIPTHLLTREAMRLYRSRLSEHGSIAFHISNGYFDFAPLVAALANDAGMVTRRRLDGRPANIETMFAPSSWAVVARTVADLGPIARDPRWTPPRPGARVWTDDYSSIVTLLRAPS